MEHKERYNLEHRTKLKLAYAWRNASAVALRLVATSLGLLLFSADIHAQQAAQADNQEYNYFDYHDKAAGRYARVYLPGSSKEWNVGVIAGRSIDSQNPPRLFPAMSFRLIKNPSVYGVVRVIPKFDGYECGFAFKYFAEAEGLKLWRYSGKELPEERGKTFLMEYELASKNTVAASKVICARDQGIEVMVVVPNDAKYSDILTDVTRLVDFMIYDPAVPKD